MSRETLYLDAIARGDLATAAGIAMMPPGMGVDGEPLDLAARCLWWCRGRWWLAQAGE